MIALLIFAAALAQPSGSPTNPLFDGADPELVSACGNWWIYPTTQGGRPGTKVTDKLFAWRSSDLVHWSRTAPVLDMATIKWIGADGAARHALWAPTLLHAKGRYFLYYSVGPQHPTPSRIGVAVAIRPEGPFVDSGRPLLTGGDHFEAIDPMVFTDPKSGKTFLYAGGSAGATLRVFELKPDMTEIEHEVPVETPPNFTEGAFMHERGGTYYFSYSHGRFNAADYSVHYATAPTPTGPWSYQGAILSSDPTHKGPGHHAFAQNPDTGSMFIAYHRWERTDETGLFKGARSVAIETVQYDGDGHILPIRMTDGTPPESLLRAKHCARHQ